MRRGIRLVLTLPVLRLGVGPFAIDPFEQLVGAKIADLLEPLMAGPQTERRIAGGARVDVFPLELPDGDGATVPLGAWGELGFLNQGGRLVITVPAFAAPLLVARLGSAMVERSEPARSLDGRVRVVNLTVRLSPGARVAFPLGGIGEIGLEAG